MSRNRKKKNVLSVNGPFALIYHEVIDSQAFKLISHPAKIVYLLLRRQCNPHNQRNIIFPADDACKYMSRSCFFRAIRNLEKYGFIKANRKGQLTRVPNEYLLIDRWKSIQEERIKRPLHGIVLKGVLQKDHRKGKKGPKIGPSQGLIEQKTKVISPSQGPYISPSQGPGNL